MDHDRRLGASFSFEFDDAGVVARLRIADDWSSTVDLENFGMELLIAYSEQHAAATVPTAKPGDPTAPVRYPQDFQDEVMDLARETTAFLDALAAWKPEPPTSHPVTVTDRRKRVSIEVIAGRPHSITVASGWLRSTDLGEVEAASVEAFQAMEALAPPNSMATELAALQRKYARTVEHQQDYLKGHRR